MSAPPLISKCLSTWQPWAFAILRLRKGLENRDRADGRVPLNGYVGPLLLHASKRWPKSVSGQTEALFDLPGLQGAEGPALLEMLTAIKASLGCVVGRMVITRWVGDAISATGWIDHRGCSTKPPADEQMVWWIGPWAAELAMVEEFETPIKCVGRQGIFNVPAQVAAAAQTARVVIHG